MRDYVADMRAVIDAEASGEYIAGTVAERIVEKLRATDPDLLTGWLDVQAVNLIRDAIGQRDRSQRTAARYAGPRSVFSDAADAAQNGDSSRLRGLLTTVYVVDETNLRKPLASMTAEDLKFASGAYADRAADMKMHATFLAAVARKVKAGKTVGDHFTEQQLADMLASLTR